MKDFSKEKIYGIIGTAVFHILVLLLLYLLVMEQIPPQPEKSNIEMQGTAAIAAALLLILFRILDLVIGRVDLLHLFCSHFIPGIQVRVVLLCQFAVCPLDLLIAGIGVDTEHLVRIIDHVSSLAFAPFPLKFTHTPL